jgi:DNA repair protein RadC
MKNKSIKEWPEDERPRERLLRFGAEELSTAQLLAIILKTGGKNKSALALAREILTQFDSLKDIEDASAAEFSEVKGLGSAKLHSLRLPLNLEEDF